MKPGHISCVRVYIEHEASWSSARYNLGRCDVRSWRRLNDDVYFLSRDKHSVVAAASREGFVWDR